MLPSHTSGSHGDLDPNWENESGLGSSVPVRPSGYASVEPPFSRFGLPRLDVEAGARLCVGPASTFRILLVCLNIAVLHNYVFRLLHAIIDPHGLVVASTRVTVSNAVSMHICVIVLSLVMDDYG